MKRRLLWELRYRRDEFSIKAGRVKGRPDPEWFLDCPALLPGEELLFIAFWALRTEAHATAQSVGRIPWSRCREYGREVFGWSGEMLDYLWDVIYAIDSGFLEWQQLEHDRHVRINKPKKARKDPNANRYDRQVQPL